MKIINIPYGRLQDWMQERHSKENDLELWLRNIQIGKFGGIKLIKFSTRKQLEAFNKKAGMLPFVFTVVKDNCKLYAHQREQRDCIFYGDPGDYESSITIRQ